MTATISTWGNSQGLRFPKDIMRELELAIGDKVKLFVENNRVIVEPIKEKKVYSIDALIADIPLDYQKEKELFVEPMGREIW